MEIIKYDNPKEFLNQNGEYLYKKEVENNLLIGTIENFENIQNKNDILLYSIIYNQQPVLVAIMTPQWDMLLYSENVQKEYIEKFIVELQDNKISFPGILAEKKTAQLFQSVWKNNSNKELLFFRNERIYKLTNCTDVKLTNGKIRKATKEDIDLLTKWNVDFHKDINEEIDFDHAKGMVKNLLNQIFLWVTDEIVSICCSARETSNSRIINMVYTPPQNRKKGYATSLVKSRCQEILDNEKQFCGLFTDLSNPTSNSIYQKIGFEPMMDLLHYKFKN